jgi:hypothetical protein
MRTIVIPKVMLSIKTSKREVKSFLFRIFSGWFSGSDQKTELEAADTFDRSEGVSALAKRKARAGSSGYEKEKDRSSG